MSYACTKNFFTLPEQGFRYDRQVSNEQLYLAIGVPIVVNILFNGVILGFFWLYINKRFDLMEAHFNTRFDDLKDMWRAELKRVEDVIDARLAHLEKR